MAKPVEEIEEDISTPQKALQSIFKVIDKSNPYASFLDSEALSTVKGWLDTGSLGLNAIISGSVYGGVPEGRVTVLAGPSQCGKSFIIQKMIANAQKKGLTCIVFDSENAITEEASRGLGVDPSKVKYVPIISLEECRNTIYNFGQQLLKTKSIGKFAIFIDSLGNIESQLQLNRMEKDNTSSDVSRAKSVKSLLRTCTNMATLTRTTVVISNHIYDDPMAMFPTLEKVMPGGKSTVYLPSVTVQLARRPIKEGDKLVKESAALAVGQKSFSGVILRGLTVKNRFIKQYLEIEMYLSFERGLSKYYGLVDLAEGLGVLTKDGHKFVLASTKQVLGKYKDWKTNEEYWDKLIIPQIEEKIKIEWAYGNKVGQAEEDGPDEVADDQPEEQ